MPSFSDSDIGTQMIKGPLCRNCDIHIYLARCYNRALCFGIGDSHTFARRYAPSNAVLCLSRPLAPAPTSQGSHATQCFEPTIYTDSWFVELAIFYTPKSAIQNSRLGAFSVLNRWRGCQVQGGRRSHSGAMVTDDNEADGALSGEAGETSFQP